MTGVIVFDGKLLRATLFNGGDNAPSERMYVTLRQRLGTPGDFSAPQMAKSFVKKGYCHLHLQSRWNDWYINDETGALEAALTALTIPCHEVIAMGFSMGGYGALRFARALRLQRLIAVSPQYSISPAHVPFDRRFRRSAVGFDPDLGDLRLRGSDVQGVILADMFHRRDLMNAELIMAAFPNLSLARLPGGGHPATQVLREAGYFGQLQKQLLQGRVDPGAIAGIHRESRRHSQVYWRNLEAMALKRGRDSLALTARVQAIVLADPS